MDYHLFDRYQVVCLQIQLSLIYQDSCCLYSIIKALSQYYKFHFLNTNWLYQMLIEVNTMIECLRQMQSKQPENHKNKLVDLCVDPMMLLNFKIILADINLEQSTKKMAAVFLKKYFEDRYSDFDEVFYVEFIISIIMDENVSYKLKVLLEETIVVMLEWIEKENLSQVIDCIQTAFFCLEKASGKEIVCLQKNNINKKKNLDATKLDLAKYCKFSLQSQQQFFNLAYSVIHLVECFSSVLHIQCQDLHRVVRISLPVSLTIFPMKNTQIHLRLQMVILHMWLVFIQFLESEKQNKPDFETIQQEIVEEDFLWTKILEAYNFLGFNFMNVQTLQPLLVCSPEQPERRIINKMKNYACEIHLKLLKFQSYNTDKVAFLNKTIDPPIFTVMLKTLSYFSTVNRGMLTKCESEQFLNSLLSLFIFICQQNPEIIDINWNNIIHLVIFPLLTISERQFLYFDEEPEQFSKLAEDCCDKQNLGELKTQAARFLQIVCDRNPVYCQYVVHTCIISIQTHISQAQSKIQNISSLLSLESAFMILSISSYSLVSYPLQMQEITKILKDPHSLKLSQIQASRVFLFLAYNYSQVFKNILEGKTWIYFAMSGNMHQTTKLAAFDFLLNMVDDFFQEQFLTQFSQKLISQNNIKQVWQVLNKFLNFHLQEISQGTMVKFVQKVLQRMSSQITRYKNRQIKTTANINTGLQLMRKILTNNKFCSNKPQVLQQIWKVIPLYKTFKELNLEDVILKIINQFMERKQKKIDQIFQNMLPQIIDQFRVDQYRTTAFYWIFNQFIFKQPFVKIIELRKVLMQGLDFLHIQYLENKKKISGNLPIAHTLLLIQHMLMIHGKIFTKDQVFQLFSVCKLMLPQDLLEPQRFNISPFIIGRILIIMTICQMLSRNQMNPQAKQIDALKYLLIYHDEDQVFIGHNAEVIVKLLCKWLFTESDPVSVTEMINMMVRIIRPSPREKQTLLGKKNSAKKNSLKIRLKKRENFEMILQKIKSPFDKNVSSEEELKNALNKMKENNQFLYKSMINYLPEQIKEKLRDLISTSQLSAKQDVSLGKSRKIIKISGVKQVQKGKSVLQKEQSLGRSKKRYANFDQKEQDDQNFQEIPENELILQNDKEDSYNDDQERKRKLKKSKMMKKHKQNQQSLTDTTSNQ